LAVKANALPLGKLLESGHQCDTIGWILKIAAAPGNY